MEVHLHPFTANSPALNQAARVYSWVWQRAWDTSYQYLERYTQQTQFTGLLAKIGQAAVGMGFGVPGIAGDWWYDRVCLELGADHQALQQAWVLMELAVLPTFQNRQIGGKLHDTLVTSLPFKNALLSTAHNNTGAQRFYQRRGWQVLHEGFTFYRGGAEYMIMHLLLE